MTNTEKTTGLDSFTRKYLYVLAGLALVGFVLWLGSYDFRVGEINSVLEADSELAAYPFPFRVLTLENGVARMSSSRSAQLSVIQSLRVMFPELQQKDPMSDEMMAAQVELARLQSRAAELVTKESDVTSVRWVLDKAWLAKRGIYVE
ncbi:hypothetical protein [Marinobacter piscensis]|uniref:hypothetical protein n=1 Tax=Marinobacter piscensis TaxID=1562308 RepID=UPI0011A61279|nr:hypothetical protein [Marinobacter piscensis]